MYWIYSSLSSKIVTSFIHIDSLIAKYIIEHYFVSLGQISAFLVLNLIQFIQIYRPDILIPDSKIHKKIFAKLFLKPLFNNPKMLQTTFDKRKKKKERKCPTLFTVEHFATV